MSLLGLLSLLVWLHTFDGQTQSADPPTPATSSVLKKPHRPEWSRFRGPDGLGVVASCNVPLPWAETQATRIDLPGTGNGSPVLFGSTAYLLTANPDDATRTLVCIDLQRNRIHWTKSFPGTPHKLHKQSSYASTTPCVDGYGIYVAWADPENLVVKSFTHAGEEKWSRDLGPYVSQHGFGTSPILVDGKLVLLDSQDAQELEPGVSPGQDRMLALEPSTGETIWQRALPTTRVCYGVPTSRHVDGTTEIICATTGAGIFALDAKTGHLRWRHECFEQRVCSSTLLLEDHDLVIATHGSGGGRDNLLVAWDLKTQSERYRLKRNVPYVPTQVALGDLLFLWMDSGIVSCVQVADGATVWSQRIGGNFSGSPVILGDKLVNVSDVGEVTFLAASREYKKLGSISLGQSIRSTIAAQNDLVLIRTDEQLWMIRK